MVRIQAVAHNQLLGEPRVTVLEARRMAGVTIFTAHTVYADQFGSAEVVGTDHLGPMLRLGA